MPDKSDQRIESIAQRNGVILLYHSIAASVPDTLKKTLHNICPLTLQKHIEDLSGYFKFVSLSEYSQALSKKGLIAITFDDGYKNVIENAVPVLESFDCPATLFINPLTFSKRWNWRDKVRYLIYHQQDGKFSKQFDFQNKSGRFYRYSKHPLNNSATLDQSLDEFLKTENIDLYNGYPYLQEQDLIINHPLIEYGNHSQNHYVLSSLTDKQQYDEIELAHKALNSKTKLTLSRCFAAPFGASRDINRVSSELIKHMGYDCLLMSRQNLQPFQPLEEELQVLERFMPRTVDIIEELVYGV